MRVGILIRTSGVEDEERSGLLADDTVHLLVGDDVVFDGGR